MAKALEKNEARLRDSKTPAAFSCVSDLLRFAKEAETAPIFFEWNGNDFVWDCFSSWLFADFSIWNIEDGHPTSDWLPLTNEFETPEEALDFPFLEGKSLRDRFAEVSFFLEC